MNFRDFIYLDTEALGRYSAQLERAEKSRIRAKSIKASAGANLGVASASIEVATERADRIGSSDIELFDDFERRLEDASGDGYFDFLTDDPDIKTLPPMSLFRIQGRIEVPEGFDVLSLVRQYAPMMFNAGLIDVGEDGNVPPELVRDVLGNVKADIPIIVVCDGATVSAKLNFDYIAEGDELELEGLSDEEVVFLCKATAHKSGESVVVFDPLKDFMRINRAMRRSMNGAKELASISVPGPVLKSDVVAIHH